MLHGKSGELVVMAVLLETTVFVLLWSDAQLKLMTGESDEANGLAEGWPGH